MNRTISSCDFLTNLKNLDLIFSIKLLSFNSLLSYELILKSIRKN